MSTAAHYLAARLFTGKEWLQDQVVTIERGVISQIVPATEKPGPYTAQFPILAPGLIDIQIYGAQDQLLAEYPTAEAIGLLYQSVLEGGATSFQPTVATNSYEVFHACIDAVRHYWQQGGKGCIGLHLEGPWINPVKRGAHVASFIHTPTQQEVATLLEYGKNVITMITLAPEYCEPKIIRQIQDAGVVVSAGHSNATYTEGMQAFNQGITTATHLYNAMSALQHREPGLVGAIFDHDKVMCSVIPDGYHVDYAAIRIAKHIMGNRLFAITDAVTNTVSGPYPHTLAVDRYESNGTLSGSALNMLTCVNNLVHKAGIALDESLRMCSLYPAQVMGLSHRKGRIQTGYDAELVAFHENLELITVIG
jgi:N-acetylglucosamine-6-phosphate deacetylase